MDNSQAAASRVQSRLPSSERCNTALKELLRAAQRINFYRPGLKKAADWESGSISVRKYPEIQIHMQPNGQGAYGFRGEGTNETNESDCVEFGSFIFCERICARARPR